MRAPGVEVEVVSPATFRHFGVAYGAGVVGNLRARRARALALPAFLSAFSRAARRAARDADLVHAHWLPSGLVALSTGRPFVLQLWGTDVELARPGRPLARSIVRRARIVVARRRRSRRRRARSARGGASHSERRGPPGRGREGGAPSEVLYVGSPLRGEGRARARGGDRGTEARRRRRRAAARARPGALGFVPHHELSPLYARAAVVASRRAAKGSGWLAREAMAHGRPVVASAVGGLLDLVVDGETGILVPPGDADALRAGLARVLDDAQLRRSMGAAARKRAEEKLSWDRVTLATLAAYGDL